MIKVKGEMPRHREGTPAKVGIATDYCLANSLLLCKCAKKKTVRRICNKMKTGRSVRTESDVNVRRLLPDVTSAIREISRGISYSRNANRKCLSSSC